MGNRSRSRDRSPVRIKRESVSSSSANRRRESSIERKQMVRIKQEDVAIEPIYLDSKGRPHRRDARSGRPSSPSDSSTVLEPEKPNFEPSGLLAAETNKRNGVALKYTPPPESRMPRISWRLYVFKPDEAEGSKMKVIKTIHLDANEYYLIGCDRRVADVELFHPTISKQHAVIQHRLVDGKRIVPYIIDLESTNGTFLNGERIMPSRYYEIRENDVLKFGLSSREYVVLNDQSV
ncbi:Smad nuclear-interacting protein 1 [Babesia sp. Xinjiang]|uniref:Smad nuclear-interacting protein 1 n=1 Tax=Babesia sp. Xinjiang TaxID=462227 RepID=UPI000A218E34|nr:Smad nuclear-interacting protein 1 [Babesia sp. Xinjiang]XP_028872102.1 Smad nuclear-interacting protein 1 [Babesia sp. Xinjiang]ORM41597.1 Smad nuclear-interacting protein 1 [Babesia sp. Xinjiang]ORM41646.1 Smad nuclear-interacting protein 1 [Babesia sp. Xinjiang]